MTTNKKQLILGAGKYPKPRIYFPGREEYEDAVKLDINPDNNPDVLWDLNNRPLPFEDNEFDEIHAYDVLEHVGKQGDFISFFEEFAEYYRIIKDQGDFLITSPLWDGRWAWGDPGHTRIISKELFSYLDKDKYEGSGDTAMSDYRKWLKCDFKFITDLTKRDDSYTGAYVLRAYK